MLNKYNYYKTVLTTNFRLRPWNKILGVLYSTYILNPATLISIQSHLIKFSLYQRRCKTNHICPR